MLLFISIVTLKKSQRIYFNTSHVTVYPMKRILDVGLETISIHLMLLFIPFLILIRNALTNFNTSHVTVYQCINRRWCTKNKISIHLMLLFIPHSRQHQYFYPYISIHLMLLFIFFKNDLSWQDINFNTSHVTVYPSFPVAKTSGCIFQYISCYCLSSAGEPRPNIQLDFNTSHVTVYQ